MLSVQLGEVLGPRTLPFRRILFNRLGNYLRWINEDRPASSSRNEPEGEDDNANQ